MKAMNFKGVVTALVSPFRGGNLDENSFRRLVVQQLQGGIEGFVINGTTGESPTLSWDEVRKLVKWARAEVGGEFPLIVGTGTNSTADTIEKTRRASELDVNAVLVVTPYYNKPPQRGLVQHFRQVADASSLPVILYNVPGRTQISMAHETIMALAAHPQVVGVKEASGNVEFGAQVSADAGDNFFVTSGDDGTCIDLALAGGEGVISVVSHVIPSEARELMDRARKGDRDAAIEFKRFSKLLELIYCESNPIPVKAALALMGVIDSAELRLPLVELDPEWKEMLRTELKALGKV